MSDDVWLPQWDAALYARNTGHHRAFDDWFLAATPLAPNHRIVDLGCGSGDFTRVLADRVPDGEVVGVDPHTRFVEEAAGRAGPNQRFVVGSGQRLVTALGGETFDGVVSRAALQWAPCGDHALITQQVRATLRPGGYYRLEMGGSGNIERVVGLLDELSRPLGGPTSPWCFPNPGWYLELLEAAGFELAEGHVRAVAQRRPFDAESLWTWFESQVFQAYEIGMDPSLHSTFRDRLRDRLGDLARPDGTFDLTYVRLDVLAWAPAD
jgi:trans-aconitate methyltransferase